jgi:hypothetical protein
MEFVQDGGKTSLKLPAAAPGGLAAARGRIRLVPAMAPAASWVSSPTISVIVRGIETGLAVGLYWTGR